jgi:UvrD-like helicase C-terminal domain/AAA domain/Nuclease-related domain
MAHLLPSDISELSLSLGETAELRTLEKLRSGLPSAYTVFHSVHWSRDAAYHTAFGEADFIVANQSGEVVVIEQKSGALDESADGLIKQYSDGRKNVASQIHRTLDGIRDQFKRQSGHDIALDYLIYCPDYRLRDLNAVGLAANRIVDARDATRLADRITSILAPGSPTDFGKRVLRFFENRFHLVPDIHAHVTAGERAMIRLSGGLADTLSAIEMKPLRLRVRGTAGCGKSIVASRFAEGAVATGKRVLLVCFNRPLAERVKMNVSRDAHVNTFYGFMDRFLISRGHKLAYERIGERGFWEDVQERVIGETIGPEWKFDALIVDEGQDFEPQWSEILRLFLKPDADLLWLEDLDQSIRPDLANNSTSEPAYERLAPNFIGFHTRANYRSPETIARYIQRVLPFDFLPCNPLPGLGVGVAIYKDAGEQSKRVAAIVTGLIRTGFRHSDIVILSMRGLARATFAHEKRVGAFTLSRPTGAYDLLGNQVFENGQLRFDTVYRFKGQQAPAIILTDVDPDQDRPDHADRLLFTAMTRATVRLELVLHEGNSAAERLMNV